MGEEGRGRGERERGKGGKGRVKRGEGRGKRKKRIWEGKRGRVEMCMDKI